ncbi:hypothetical protein Bca52824_027871 [Brassica carinata]|uniref:Uncharacterized protein n=2 Tax=Brassiceae TaxID=981071 RepID=A0A8X8ANY4_BRACI|nr:hypothetical protein Bca52824_027871 [Brassica carinata]
MHLPKPDNQPKEIPLQKGDGSSFILIFDLRDSPTERLLSPYIGRGGSQVPRSKITISALVVISGIKESTKANKVDSLLSQLATGIAADLVVLLFYGLAAERVRIESRSSPAGERQGMILLRYELAEGMKRYSTKTGTGIPEDA